MLCILARTRCLLTSDRALVTPRCIEHLQIMTTLGESLTCYGAPSRGRPTCPYPPSAYPPHQFSGPTSTFPGPTSYPPPDPPPDPPIRPTYFEVGLDRGAAGPGRAGVGHGWATMLTWHCHRGHPPSAESLPRSRRPSDCPQPSSPPSPPPPPSGPSVAAPEPATHSNHTAAPPAIDHAAAAAPEPSSPPSPLRSCTARA